MRRRAAPRQPEYPQGDRLPGVVFYLIDARQLTWPECVQIARDMAVEFAQNGPFRVRIMRRRVDDNMFWLGFNHAECGVAFELVVGPKAYKTKSVQLPGGNPTELRAILDSDEFRSFTQGGGGGMGDEFGDEAPAPVRQEPQYADRHTGVVFYRLDKGEIEVAIVVETLNDIAAIMLQPMGRALPFALRRGIRQEPAPSQHYWVGLNSGTAGVLFERTLEQLQVRVTKRTKLPDGTQPVLRLILDLPGVPVLPVPRVPIAQQVPEWSGPDPLPMPLLDEEPAPVQRDRLARIRGIDVRGMAARMRGRMPGRRGRQSAEEPPGDEA